MKIKIVNQKKFILVMLCLIIGIIIIGLLAYFNYIKPNLETSANLEEERIAEEPVDEYVDIEALEENIIQVEIIDESENNSNENNSNENNSNENNNNQNNNQNNSNVNQNRKPTVATNNIPYYIKVNYGAQVVTIYSKDSQGNYTIPVKAMVCSTGVATPTSGVYTIPARWEWLRLEGYVFGHYSTQITGNILFHSVPYLVKDDPASLEYWEYDKLGTYASAGCVRLTVRDAKWIYDNCARGTKVEFYSSSDPGPLGKPSAKKISSYPDYLRNWDPTDSNSNNPWHTYQEPPKQEEKPEEEKTKPENPPKQEEKPNKPTKNEIVNETTNEKQNQTANEIVNETTKEQQNQTTNEIVNETTKE